MNLIQRATDIILKPRQTWPAIEQEPGDVASIYSRYLVFMALIPALATFIGLSFVGVGMFGVSFRVPVVTGLVNMVVSYVLSLVMVFLLALLTDALAPTFGGTKNQVNALKVVAYGCTAGFLGGLFSLIPALSVLGLLASLYTVYLIYTGLPVLMKCPEEKAVAYTAVVVVCGIVAVVVLGLLSSLVLPSPTMNLGGMPGQKIGIQTPSGEVTIDTSKMEEAGQRMKQAQASGDSAAAGKAMNDMMGAMSGATGGGEPLPLQEVKALVPASLGGLARESIESQSNQAMGMAGSSVKARYAAGERSVELAVIDLGGLSGVAALAGWAGTTMDKETAEKTERIYKEGSRTFHEEFWKNERRGGMGVLLANGVMVEARGQGMDAAELKGLLVSLDLARIEGMKRPAKP